MLSKEECEQALMNICSSNSRIEDRKVFKSLIDEHFELFEKYNTLLTRYSALENPQPYKFKDLKECDFVYDKKEKEIVLIMETSKNHKTNEKIVYTLVMGCEDLNKVPFKENRFYPVHIANVR